MKLEKEKWHYCLALWDDFYRYFSADWMTRLAGNLVIGTGSIGRARYQIAANASETGVFK